MEIFPIPRKESLIPDHEFFSKIFTVEGKRIPFTKQETPANCGPLSIVNGMNAFKGVCPDFTIPENFPKTSDKIRELLAENIELRRTSFNTLGSEEIKQSSCALQGEHLSNLVHILVQNSNIEIIGDRFSGKPGFPAEVIPEMVLNSDWIISHKGYHYTSYVRIDENRWLHLDSMNTEPVLISQDTVVERNSDVGNNLSYFMCVKLKEGKGVEIFEKIKPEVLVMEKKRNQIIIKPKINFIRKE